MSGWDDLIERLEKATEGSRELDAAIWALDAAIQGPLEFGHEQYSESARREWVKCGSLGAWLDEIAHYTTSIDAALTLELCEVPFKDGGQWFALLRPRGVDHTGSDIDCDRWLATPALALCIAALKARKEQQP